MSNLRQGERMQRCLYPLHKEHRKQDYYLVRTYYNLLENHICQGCCNLLSQQGYLRYLIDGYIINDIDPRFPEASNKRFIENQVPELRGKL